MADPSAKIGDVQVVTLVVLGASVVGKSSFVRCALDLKKASSSALSSKKVSLEGKISIVRLLELGFEDLEITADQNVRWPTKVGDYDTPIIDGVLALYDVMDQGSIARIPALLSESIGRSQSFPSSKTVKTWEMCYRFDESKICSNLHYITSLEALSRRDVPTVLVSANSDAPRGSWEVDPDMIDELCSTVTGIEFFSVSLSAPETHKSCISTILRNVLVKRLGELLPSLA